MAYIKTGVEHNANFIYNSRSIGKLANPRQRRFQSGGSNHCEYAACITAHGHRFLFIADV